MECRLCLSAQQTNVNLRSCLHLPLVFLYYSLSIWKATGKIPVKKWLRSLATPWSMAPEYQQEGKTISDRWICVQYTHMFILYRGRWDPSIQQISKMEEKPFTSSLTISSKACCRKGWGRSEWRLPHSSPYCPELKFLKNLRGLGTEQE
jgi:hypothetical protein